MIVKRGSVLVGAGTVILTPLGEPLKPTRLKPSMRGLKFGFCCCLLLEERRRINPTEHLPAAWHLEQPELYLFFGHGQQYVVQTLVPPRL
jgi:hypothetical protein